MTKIHLDIDSDDKIMSANVIIKYLNGKQVTENIDVTSSSGSSIDSVAQKRVTKQGIDSAFTQSY